MKLALALCATLLFALLVQAEEGQYNKECTVAETKSTECEKCVCIPPGRWACVNMCSQKDECKVGQTKSSKCEKCLCIPPGRWVCVNMCLVLTEGDKERIPRPQ